MNSILFSLGIAMLLENFSVPEEEKRSTQKRMYDRKVRASLRSRRKRRQSSLVATIKGSEGVPKHVVAGGSYDQLLHAAHGADLDSPTNKSLYMFKLDSKFRLGAAKIQQHPLFGKTIMLLILMSCVSLALEGPGEGSSLIPEGGTLAFLFTWANSLVLGAFIFESSLKTVVHGFMLKSGPTDPYLSTRMNRMDFFIIILCLLSYWPVARIDGTWAKCLRLGRVITPMINLSKNPEIRLVFISFVRAGPDALVVVLPLVLMLLVFAIVGVANFGSQLKGCVLVDDPLRWLASPHELVNKSTGEKALNTLNQTFCEQSPTYAWVNLPFNFDNSIIGTATLLVALTDGAHGLMLKTTMTSDAAKAFWVAFHMCFTCFFLNLFIGVLSASFEKSSGASLMSLGEKQWEALRRTLLTYKPSKVSGDGNLRPVLRSRCLWMDNQPVWWFEVRNRAYQLAHNERLEHLWRFGILANTATLATDMYPISTIHVQVVWYLNLAFLTICVAEVIVKLTGLGFKAYFRNGWLVSDFILVSVSLFLRLSGYRSGIEVLRVMRVFRMIVLASKLPALVSLIETLILCLQASAALLLIMCAFIYLYSVAGMSLFGLLPEQHVIDKAGISEDEALKLRQSGELFREVCPQCTHLTDYTNFNDFPSAFQLLVQVMLGQEIGGFTVDMQYLGAEFWEVFIYLSSFYVATVWICMNLFIVTVLTNFDKATITGMEGDSAIKTIDFDGFAHVWASLTIGVHGAYPVQKMEPDLLEHLMQKIQNEAVERDEIESVNIDATQLNTLDGDPALCGTLKIHIKQVTDIADHGERVYCKMTAFGPASHINLQTLSTPTRNVKDGVASWQQKHVKTVLNLDGTLNHDNVVTEDGCCLRLNITGHHTHLDFDVLSAFQFSEDRIGGQTIDMDEIRAAGRLEAQLKLSVDKTVPSERPAGDMNRWVRFVHVEDDEERGVNNDDDDEAEEPLQATEPASNGVPHPAGDIIKLRSSDIESPSEIPSNNKDVDDEDDGNTKPISLTKADKRALQIEEMESKKEAQMRKKAKKQAKKAAKRIAKAEKKQQQLDKKAAKAAKKVSTAQRKAKSEPEPEPEPEPQAEPQLHRFHMPGWSTCGAVLHVTFEYEPMVAVQKQATFMNEYSVQYLNKESNCGVEGWLEVSENDGPFERRFCYILDAPTPCMKIALGCSTITALESQSSRNCLDLHSLPGNQILSVFANHDVKAKGKKRKDVSFQVVATEDSDSGRLEQAQIAFISGKIIGATRLKASSKAGGCVVIEEAAFDDSSETDNSKRPKTEAPDGGDGDGHDEAIDAEKFDIPVRYMCAADTSIYRNWSMESEQTGSLKAGKIVVVTHTKALLDGPQRLLTAEGWVSATCDDGLRTNMISEDNRNKHYRIIRKMEIGNFVELSKSRIDIKRGNGRGILSPNDVVEALEETFDPDTGLDRIRLRDGWISRIDPTVKATVDTYCVVSVVPAKDTTPPTDQAAFKRTKTVEDSLVPQWKTGFNLKVFSSSTRFIVRVFNANAKTPEEIGMAELVLGEDGIPGGCISGTALSQSPQQLRTNPVKLEVALETGIEGHRSHAGSVILEVSFFPTVPRADLLAARSRHANGDLCQAMMVPAREENVYRFRAMNSGIKREWLAALRWIATGCQGAYVPLEMPIAKLFDDQMTRVENDISVLDLPFSRATLLYHGLYDRRIIGAHKPTRRRLVYTLFSLEMFSCTKSQQQVVKKSKKYEAAFFDGVSLADLRGLNFHLTLERLVLLHYGKARCLSFDTQMHEYETEVENVAMQCISTVVAWWVFKIREGKTVNDSSWPWHTAWRKYPQAYRIASHGAVASRLRTLRILKAEVERHSRPALMVSTADSACTCTWARSAILNVHCCKPIVPCR
eukprot:COSAG02_NODE_852_length_16531_cov_9.899586_2_plen_1882_part_00